MAFKNLRLIAVTDVGPCFNCLIAAQTKDQYEKAQATRATWMIYESGKHNPVPYCVNCAQDEIAYGHSHEMTVMINGEIVVNPLPNP